MIKPLQASDQETWYKDAIIYELHIKAFFDSNGDGIGDFEGLLEKLDYLEDLGVTAIWLLPFYPSPLKDDGYDIADYYSINPSYGDLDTFKRLIDEAHERGLKIITELVINHTSDQHPWFQRARNAPIGSPERDYYVWSDDPEKYKDTRIIFTDTEPSNWTWDPVAKQYFWHRFFSHQPDLNFDNPQVQQEVFDVLDFWFDLGVDGFRLDAVPYLFEREGTNCENLPETHEFLKKLRTHVDSKYENKLLLAEANMWPEDSAEYFGEGDECHMNYHFPIMPRMFMSVKMEDRYPIMDIIDQTPDIPENCQWAIFLRNHDELTLEMVTDEERDYMYKVYTKDPQAKINVGIRHRLAPLLENNRNKIELMNVLLFSLPGTPVIYYGDEIGMGDNFYLGDRDGVRTPMQWSSHRNAGFSHANPHKLYLPVIIDPSYKYESINVETEQMNSSSLLWWMKRIISMRKKFKAFGRGDINFLSPSNAKIIAYTRTFEDEDILVLGNLSRFPQAAELDLEAYEGYIPVEVFSHNKFPRVTEHPYLFTMAPHGYYWFQLQKEEGHITKSETPLLQVDNWEQLLQNKTRYKFEHYVLPEYLNSCRWFGGKSRVIQNINVVNKVDIPVKDMPSTLITIEVSYNDGLPEVYQLPLGFLSPRHDEEYKEIPAKGIIAKLKLGEEEGYLFDAVYSESFRNVLFKNIKKGRKLQSGRANLVFYHSEDNFEPESEKVHSKILNAEQSNTSLIFDNKYFLKLYRKLDNTINPDLEITRYLTEKTEYKNSPRFVGAIEYKPDSKNIIVLGMMQDLIPNQGDAWDYTKDALNRFFDRVLTLPKEKEFEEVEHTLTPLSYQDLSENMQELMGAIFPERMFLLGQRTAEMHKALAANPLEKDFEPEPFSLHYQRSLFSSLQSLTRNAFQNLQKSLKTLPKHIQEEAQEVLSMKNDVLEVFKKVYNHKIPIMKIRTHGDYHLGQVLWTGKDFVIIDFEGEPARSFSERRLKRSPLRDVAGMVRSFHYAAFGSILESELDAHNKEGDLDTWAENWYYLVTQMFLKGYYEHVGENNFIPDDEEDTKVLMQIFLLEKAIYEMNYELNNRPDWVLIPLRGIKSCIKQ
ncbi:maltose alpha-D-glucosyltransferase [Salinimicrobium sediminilitoris]|uniref:maltose alpha-D-glucosyltransferase n=1 Tax=Salinimicrobium sediminilitoris TaxID=2876715 RepID=UPI001E3E7E5D|nr:maltose alpha-D-glucosyltransferase [Salinimicrobium sediminilitoris]MCC8360351.1 maltose alpha-D-glucosyltransferase [Salinimicrobium sediminilitoris]